MGQIKKKHLNIFLGVEYKTNNIVKKNKKEKKREKENVPK